MRGNGWRIIAGAGVAAVLAAQAAATDDFETCGSTGLDGDVLIAACTRAIASGRFQEANLATLYKNRALEYNHRGDLDRAIADFTESIKLNPHFAYYYNRGIIWDAKGDLDRAIADYSETIRLYPRLAVAWHRRGLAWEKKDDLQKALSDFNRFSELNPRDPDGPAAVARVTKKLSGGK
jgi:tetratricopeptide (TPR) repeat protein